MDRIFETMEYSESDKRRLVTFPLTFAVADWWEAEKAIIGSVVARTMMWTASREHFLEKFFPKDEKDEKEKEFMELTQGGKTFQEYVTRSERLSRFAPHMVDTPQKKIKKFHRRLDTHLRHMTLGYLEQTFEALVRLASSLERDGYKGTSQPTN